MCCVPTSSHACMCIHTCTYIHMDRYENFLSIKTYIQKTRI